MTDANTYDRFDVVAREAAIIAHGPGMELRLAAYRVRDPADGEWSGLQFHMTVGNTVYALMGDSAAKLFANFVTKTLGQQQLVDIATVEQAAAHLRNDSTKEAAHAKALADKLVPPPPAEKTDARPTAGPEVLAEAGR